MIRFAGDMIEEQEESKGHKARRNTITASDAD
jgi:hypothetical protein